MRTKIEIDFARPSLVTVDAMQCDTLTREIEAQMLADGTEYNPTEEFTSDFGFSIDYIKKANGVRGRYEKMPDETTDAVTQSGTTLIVRIAPAVLTVVGRVILNIRIYQNSTGATLRSFPVVLNVLPAAVGDSQPDEDYWDIKSLADVTAALNDCVSYSEMSGKTEQQKAAARSNIGAESARSDVTAAYEAAHTLTPSLRPEQYLARQSEGRYKIVLDTELYLSDNEVVEGMKYARILSMTDDGEMDQMLYINESMRVQTYNSAAGTKYMTKLKVGTPTAADDAAPKSYVDEHAGGASSAMLAPAYSALGTYAVGDYCVQDDKLYRCIVPIAEPEAFTAAHWQEVTVSGELTDKANTSGTYNNLTAGHAKEAAMAEEAAVAELAENLKSTVGETDTAPYSFRTAGGSLDVGSRMELRKLVGCTFRWNQLIKNGNFNSVDANNVPTDWTSTNLGGTIAARNNILSYTISTVSSSGASNRLADQSGKTFRRGHKFSVTFKIKPAHAIKVAIWFYGTGGGATNTQVLTDTLTAGAWQTVQKIVSFSDTDKTRVAIALNNPSAAGYEVGDVDQMMDYQIIDLTEGFGTVIADQIYALEQTTAGAGGAWVKRYLPRIGSGYYAHDAGSLQSVKVASRKAVGFNAYKHTTGTAKLVGGMEWQITGSYTALSFMPDGGSAEAVIPDASGKFTPASNGTLTVTGGNASDTCVHLVWDGERDGEFEAYEEHVYSLGSDELRGLPTLDANGNLTADGDEKTPDGKIKRKYATENLGELAWSYNATIKAFVSSDYAVAGGLLPASNGTVAAVRALGYDEVSYSSLAADLTADKLIAVDANGYLYVRNLAYTDVAAFEAAVTGVTMLYKLAAPTTAQGTAYTEEQAVDNWGTEELVDAGVEAGDRDVAIPAGHESWYPVDLRAKLETLPSVPESNGEYMLDVDDGSYSYKALAQAAVIAGLLARIPPLPSEDGTYRMQCTVADGEQTCGWVAES